MPINRKSWLDLLKYSPVVGAFSPCPGAGLLTTLKKIPRGFARGDVGAWNWLMHKDTSFDITFALLSPWVCKWNLLDVCFVLDVRMNLDFR